MSRKEYITTKSNGYVIDPRTKVVLNLNEEQKINYEAQKQAFLESLRLKQEVSSLQDRLSRMERMLETLTRNTDVGYSTNS